MESEKFSLDVLHFDPKHRTFNTVSIVCIALTILSIVSLVRGSYRLKEWEKKV